MRGGIFLDDRDPQHPMSILRYYIESIMCFPVIQSLFPRFISTRICLDPWVP